MILFPTLAIVEKVQKNEIDSTYSFYNGNLSIISLFEVDVVTISEIWRAFRREQRGPQVSSIENNQYLEYATVGNTQSQIFIITHFNIPYIRYIYIYIYPP